MLSPWSWDACRPLTWALVELPPSASRLRAREAGIAKVVPWDTPLARLIAPARA